MEHGAVKVAMVMKLKESCVGDTATRKLECGGLWAEIVAQEVMIMSFMAKMGWKRRTLLMTLQSDSHNDCTCTLNSP